MSDVYGRELIGDPRKMRVTPFVRIVLPLAALPLIVAVTGNGIAYAVTTDLRCHLVKEDIFDPGLSLEGGHGVFYTETPGNMTCEGTVDGHKADGKALGRFLEKGRFGTKDPDSCLTGEGDGIFGAIIPTEGDGSARISTTFTFTFGDIPLHGGVIAGKFEGKGVRGTIDIIPLEGDCVFEPVTRVYTMDEIVFSSGSAADWTFDAGDRRERRPEANRSSILTPMSLASARTRAR